MKKLKEGENVKNATKEICIAKPKIFVLFHVQNEKFREKNKKILFYSIQIFNLHNFQRNQIFNKILIYFHIPFLFGYLPKIDTALM